MTTPEDCRRKAEQWLTAAETASDPTTSASLRRVSDLWMRLAGDMEKAAATSARLKPRDLARPRIDATQVGDILRDRLRIGDDDDANDNSAAVH